MAANTDQLRSISSEEAFDRLRGLHLFAQLTPDDFSEVAKLVRVDKVQAGVSVYQQGNYNHNLYLVRKGAVMVHRVDDTKQEKLVGIYGPGAIFNAMAFSTGANNSESLEADTPVTFWIVKRDEFDKMVAANPAIRAKLQLTPEAQEILTKIAKYDWQQKDEIILADRKRHWWTWVKTAWLPILIAAAGIAVGVLLPGALEAVPFVWVIGALIAFGWMLYTFIDWRNDHFVVTTKRVVHRERILLLRDDQEQSPVSQIQNVSVDRASFIQMLLNMGEVTIETSGARSEVRFDGIGKPDEVRELIFQARERAAAEVTASGRVKIRGELRTEMGLSGAAKPAEKQTFVPARGRQILGEDMRRRLRVVSRSAKETRETLMPRIRLVRNGTITYRKHWVNLLRNLLLPSIVLAILIPLEVSMIRSGSREGAIFVFLLTCVALFWWVWNYEDWRNDIYVLTDDRIIDIKRSPFGLRGAKRKEASYTVVQNVDARTRGFLEVLFNLGDVIIRTAGVENELRFDRVMDPRGIQRDLEERLMTFGARQKDKEAQRRRAEMSEWFAVYDELRRTH